MAVKVTRTDTIFVQSNLKPTKDGGELVALFDKDDRHPGGEAFVAGADVVEVFPSPEVSGAIARGALVQVKAKAADKTEK